MTLCVCEGVNYQVQPCRCACEAVLHHSSDVHMKRCEESCDQHDDTATTNADETVESLVVGIDV